MKLTTLLEKVFNLIVQFFETKEGDTVDKLIKKYANKYNIPEEIVRGIINAESNFNPNAIRYEDHYRWLVKPLDKYHYHKDTERIGQKTSWGLMQVMGAVGREKGFEGKFLSELVKPKLSLEYGCKHLHSFYKKYNDWEDAVSSYNQGSPRKTPQGEYENQAYVDKVMNYKMKG